MPHYKEIDRFRLKDTSFASLMNRRIYNVLLIATKYDTFMLEDDGRVDEQIFNEYMSLNLRYPPRFTQASNEKEALKELKKNHYELIICMPNMDDSNTFEIAKNVKKLYPDIPFIELTPFSKEVSKRLSSFDLTSVDYIFSWLGNAELLLAIIKLIEDYMNVEHDTKVGVQVILLVEDSVRFYSSALPTLFRIVLKESKEFSKEALNEHEQMLRMRGRPKILLARSYEEAVDIYDKYKDNMLGVITDMSYNRNGVKEKLAGYQLVQWMKQQDRYLPIVMTSSELANKAYADELKCPFIDKNSKSFPLDLKKQIMDNFGFGDFIIRNPQTQEIIFRIKNLKDLQKNIMAIPIDSLEYHMSHNHFSRFFYSRVMFPVAELLKKIDAKDLANSDDARQIIYDAILEYRRMKNSGVVAVFERDRYDEYSYFARIGEGSLGGKGRGLAFMGHLVKMHLELNIHDKLPVTIPKTVVLCTDVFDDFMENNDLYPIGVSDSPDSEILDAFLKAELPDSLNEDFMAFFGAIKNPIAIRSSSLLEDSHYQPFAGVYTTYMIPNIDDKEAMLKMLSNAIKAVYASVFYTDSKAYMTATQNVIDQEKMAVVLQEVVGTQYNNHFYPTFSGVARSLNFYPIGNELPEEGIVDIALGLGKYIVEGENALRFSPHHPHNILQLSTLDLALRETQRNFYALDLDNLTNEISTNDGFNILKLTVKDAEEDDSIRYISSTFDPYDQIINDGYYPGGRKIISFANILQHDLFPLSEVLKSVLKCGQTEMGRAIEIEFAVNIIDRERATFYLLQIRPIAHNKEMMDEDLSLIPQEDILLYSNSALGHGIYEDVYDLIYVKTESFSAANNQLIAYEIEKLNKAFTDRGKGYILVGPGRWGSSDSWLGIPVKWPHISNVKVLVELGLENYRIEPSQGTHFFQNLTSFGVGYFTVNNFMNDGSVFDKEFLDTQPAIFESQYLRHVRFESPLVTKINGKKNQAAVIKA